MFEVLFLDSHLLVVNKPAGWLVIPDGFNPDMPNLRDHLSADFGRVWVVHRLDKETSGVLVFARSAAVHRVLNDLFAHRLVEKQYRLLAIGEILSSTMDIDHPLRIDGDRAHRTIIDPECGKPASTRFQVCSEFTQGVVEMIASPHTGYTHQIRAHAAAAGFWLLNDRLYFPWLGSALKPFGQPHLPVAYPRIAARLPIQRLALHAQSVRLMHPETQKPVQFSAPAPPDFQTTLEWLSKAGGA